MAHPVHAGLMCIHSSVSPFSFHSVLICLFILLPVFLSVCVCLFFYMFLFSLSFFVFVFFSFILFFFCQFFYLSILLSLFRPVCSYDCPFDQSSVGLYMYIFFCRPSFYCRSVIFLVQLSFSLSARQSVCSFLNFLFVRSITGLRFLLSSRSSN